MKTRCISIATILVILFSISSVGALTKEDADKFKTPEDLPNELGTFVKGTPGVRDNVFFHRHTPELRRITLTPEKPAAGQPTEMKVEIENDPVFTNDKTVTVDLYYSSDEGKTWNNFQMVQGDSDEWRGTIPGFDTGTRVLYSIRARDSWGNTFVTLPCKTAFETLGAMNGDRDSTGDNQASDENLIRGSITAMYRSEKHNDKSPGHDYEDDCQEIRETRMGYNDADMYIALSFYDKCDEGNASPLSMKAYVVLAINPELDTDGVIPEKNLKNAMKIFVNVPLFRITGNLVAPCHVGSTQGIDYEQNPAQIECLITGKNVLYKIHGDAFGNNSAQRLKFMSANGAITGISPVAWEIFDFTPFTEVDFSGKYWFDVE